VRQIRVQSTRQQELIDITGQVSEAVRDFRGTAVLVYVPHTTAGVVINEHADPDVARDIVVALDQIVPEDGIYHHSEGNSPAHVRASLVGASQLIPIEQGKLMLGTWQGVFLAEFDGPRTRTVYLLPAGANE
jgi:secondary thiamine-phosphate synthase enzyme